APSRSATSITCSAGTNKNSACWSMNLRISQGQATRSTFTCSRVTHFMLNLLLHYLLTLIFSRRGASCSRCNAGCPSASHPFVLSRQSIVSLPSVFLMTRTRRLLRAVFTREQLDRLLPGGCGVEMRRFAHL